ncbi:TIGR03619 family F420-dependent LLM class oxidoreductase [Streptomycetaceae bacterium NBC_01309]
MKFGIRMPVPQMGPLEDGRYVARFAKLAEDLGFESVWTIDHALMNVEYDSRYPYKENGRTPLPALGAMPDPIVLMTHLAAHTTTIRLATGMLILPQRHPMILAKMLATLDQYAEGRLTLGIGVGWVREEVEALGQKFTDRGRRCDEYIDVMRELWTTEISEFHGNYFDFERIVSSPKPYGPGGVPLVVGGHTDAAAKRAGLRGNGFYPHWTIAGPDPDEYRRLRDVMHATAVEAGRDPDDVEVTLTGNRRPGVVELCAELGADRVVILPPGGDLDGEVPHKLEKFSRDVIQKMS